MIWFLRKIDRLADHLSYVDLQVLDKVFDN